MKKIIILFSIIGGLSSTVFASGISAVDSLANARVIYNQTLEAGRLILSSKGEKTLCDSLAKAVPTMAIDDPYLMQCISDKEAQSFTDAFFMLRAMKMGASFDQAKDGLSFTTAYGLKTPDMNDYYKLLTIFTSKNEKLKELYLSKLPYVFQTFGYIDCLKRVKSLVETRFEDSAMKTKVLECYRLYAGIENGQQAPLSKLTEYKTGATADFGKYKGKVLVVDVWAIWCSSCIKHLPDFVALSEKYKGKNVQFICVSIDRQKNFPAWKKKLEELGLSVLDNYVADVEAGSSFEGDYCISGIPRYLVIDASGKIVSAFAPGPSAELEKMIDEVSARNDAASHSSAEGIQFEDISFEEALAKAGKEGKKVFVDCYIQSCGPCKRMAAEIFPLKECGAYFNPRFVSIIRDCEAGDGIDVREKYNVQLYPTFLVINPDGTLFCKEMGSVTLRSKITFVQKMQKAMEVGEMEEKFWNGKRDEEFVSSLIPLLYEHNMERVDPVMYEYMKDFSEDQLKSEPAVSLIKQFVKQKHKIYERVHKLGLI